MFAEATRAIRAAAVKRLAAPPEVAGLERRCAQSRKDRRRAREAALTHRRDIQLHRSGATGDEIDNYHNASTSPDAAHDFDGSPRGQHHATDNTDPNLAEYWRCVLEALRCGSAETARDAVAQLDQEVARKLDAGPSQDTNTFAATLVSEHALECLASVAGDVPALTCAALQTIHSLLRLILPATVAYEFVQKALETLLEKALAVTTPQGNNSGGLDDQTDLLCMTLDSLWQAAAVSGVESHPHFAQKCQSQFPALGGFVSSLTQVSPSASIQLLATLTGVNACPVSATAATNSLELVLTLYARPPRSPVGVAMLPEQPLQEATRVLLNLRDDGAFGSAMVALFRRRPELRSMLLHRTDDESLADAMLFMARAPEAMGIPLDDENAGMVCHRYADGSPRLQEAIMTVLVEAPRMVREGSCLTDIPIRALKDRLCHGRGSIVRVLALEALVELMEELIIGPDAMAVWDLVEKYHPESEEQAELLAVLSNPPHSRLPPAEAFSQESTSSVQASDFDITGYW